MKTFAEKVKECRNALGMTQDELGSCIGISKRSVAAYETGEKLPRKNMLANLAEALRVSVEYLSDDSMESFGAPAAAVREEPASAPAAEAAVPGTTAEAEPAPVFAPAAEPERDEFSEALFHSSQLSALFAGGRLKEEDKEAVFNALSYVYNKYKNHGKK